ncbi:hypothetical protein F4553_001921 [Allocatelliglobosispora scoriae]|uniref:Uncharacterized protein n=1 Tax=Allocatelliglobosispora scoriae TaxID=643052 RepID=A0A841BP74_9ACTN|nr:hypothetical protein [Allocatelliglobosispora scoriae]
MTLTGGSAVFEQAIFDLMTLHGAGHLIRNADSDASRIVLGLDSIDDCPKIGDALAEWIATTSKDFQLQIDGPGADNTIHMIGTEYDAGTIAQSVASSAWFI